MTDLDEQYGPVIPPQNGLKAWERSEQLLRYELNQSSARQLSNLIATAAEGGMLLAVALAVTVIWMIADDGNLLFALEETIVEGGTSRRPRMRGIPLSGSVKPLGHPLLVDGAGGRIAGELHLDKVSEAALIWVLNNRSGRYGMHQSRTHMHLDNVAELLLRYGIEVETEFFEVTT